ncbi:MAG: hypothetical protein A2017_04775 [Lentisphaerae bacterium GWF2_44_16]|nr:MAG: hypothetical protein A2017_04775 [Lentisphaerae bacterium GWF2_44_16]
MNRHTFRKCLLALIVAVVVIIALMFSLVIYLMSSLISEKPLLMEKKGIDNAAVQSLSKKLQPLLPKIMSATKDSPVETISLNEKEVNALIYMSINAQDIYSIFIKPVPVKDMGPRDYNVSFLKGGFVIECSKKLKVSTPFGSYLNMRFVVIPSLCNGKERLDISSARIGGVSVPTSSASGLFNEICSKFQDTDENRKFMKVVTDIKISGDNLLISFKLDELKALIQGFMLNKFMKTM